EPRADRAFVDDQLIPVPAHASVHRPAAEGNLILNEERLLSIWPAIVESKNSGGIRIEAGWVGDRVIEALPDVPGIDVSTELQLRRRDMCSKSTFDIQFAKPAILLRDDGCSRGVRPQAG